MTRFQPAGALGYLFELAGINQARDTGLPADQLPAGTAELAGVLGRACGRRR
jgi:hypothetical protein